MPRLIFHIGFSKCGSTSISQSFKPNFQAMLDQKFYVLNDAFEIAHKASELRTPLWAIQKARTSPAARTHMQDMLRRQIDRLGKNSTLILSSEILGPANNEGMFAGFDDIADVEVVAYFRPQIDWIPSGWKQWESRVGITLKDATAAYITEGRPAYRKMLDDWQASVPKAKITLRLFARDALINGSPMDDFMTQIGFNYDELKTSETAQNPSVDYALLHLMMRHHDLFFKNRHDSALMKILVSRLPDAYLKTNAPMLNEHMIQDISAAFADDNKALLARVVPKNEIDATYARYFTKPPVPAGTAYPDFKDADILARAQGILSETFGIDVQTSGTDGRALAQALHASLTLG